jgi:hypothetical protein
MYFYNSLYYNPSGLYIAGGPNYVKYTRAAVLSNCRESGTIKSGKVTLEGVDLSVSLQQLNEPERDI